MDSSFGDDGSAWVSAFDVEQNAYYWVNTTSGESQWHQPESHLSSGSMYINPTVVVQQTSQASHLAAGGPSMVRTTLRWDKMKSKSKDKVYYHDRLTGKTQWPEPANMQELMPDKHQPIVLAAHVDRTDAGPGGTTPASKRIQRHVQTPATPAAAAAAGIRPHDIHAVAHSTGHPRVMSSTARDTPPLSHTTIDDQQEEEEEQEDEEGRLRAGLAVNISSESPASAQRVNASQVQSSDAFLQQQLDLMRELQEDRRRAEETAEIRLAALRAELSEAREEAVRARREIVSTLERERTRADADIAKAVEAAETAGGAKAAVAAAMARQEALQEAAEGRREQAEAAADVLASAKAAADVERSAARQAEAVLRDATREAAAIEREIEAILGVGNEAKAKAVARVGGGGGKIAEEGRTGTSERHEDLDHGQDRSEGEGGSQQETPGPTDDRAHAQPKRQGANSLHASANNAGMELMARLRVSESDMRRVRVMVVELSDRMHRLAGAADAATRRALEAEAAVSRSADALAVSQALLKEKSDALDAARTRQAQVHAQAQAQAQAKSPHSTAKETAAKQSRPLPPRGPLPAGQPALSLLDHAQTAAEIVRARQEGEDAGRRAAQSLAAEETISSKRAHEEMSIRVKQLEQEVRVADEQLRTVSEEIMRERQRADAAEQQATSARKEVLEATAQHAAALQAVEREHAKEMHRLLANARIEYQGQKEAAVHAAEAAERQRHEEEVLALEQSVVRKCWEAADEAAAAEREHAEMQAGALRAAAENARRESRREATLRRAAHNKVLELQGNIRVYARIRPVLDVDCKAGKAQARDVTLVQDEGGVELRYSRLDSLGDGVTSSVRLSDAAATASEEKHSFAFDRAFGPGSSQSDVWDEVKPLVQAAADGFNVCIFAYGQTGSGKTFTMEGTDENPGVNRRALQLLVSAYRAASGDARLSIDSEVAARDTPGSSGIEDTVAGGTGSSSSSSGGDTAESCELLLSVLEIHNEKVRDLLAARGSQAATSLELRASKDGGVRPEGLTHVRVRSEEEALALLGQASRHRSVGGHDMNADSSRSHLVVTATLTVPRGEARVQTSRLHLVDLAGSERVLKTGAGGARLKEAQHINTSLSALGNVVEALASRQRQATRAGGSAVGGGGGGHVPFRNSKLTHLLQGALSGNSKVLMFVNASPSLYNAPETLSSLKFALRCRAVRLGSARRGVQHKWRAEAEALRRKVRELEQRLASTQVL